jgi:hypothetical protein
VCDNEKRSSLLFKRVQGKEMLIAMALLEKKIKYSIEWHASDKFCVKILTKLGRSANDKVIYFLKKTRQLICSNIKISFQGKKSNYFY